MKKRVTLSVVLAVETGGRRGARAVTRALTALRVACAGVESEVLVMRARGEDAHVAAALASVRWRAVRAVETPPRALVPQQWAEGYRRARGSTIAFTIASCAVAPTWARAISAGIGAGFAGVGGRFSLHPEASATDAAVFHLRYGALQATGAPPGDAPREVHDVAGDNAAYRREALAAHDASFTDGFWEVDFHRRLRAAGGKLALVPGMDAAFADAPSMRTMAGMRYRHGQHAGAWRVDSGQRRRWQVLGAAPAVPVVLLLRAARRARQSSALRVGLLTAAPAFLLLATAWAVGEAVGAIARRHHAESP